MISQISSNQEQLRSILLVFFSVLCTVATVIPPAHAQSELNFSKQQWSRLDAAMTEAVESLNLPSLSMAVVHQGKLVWSNTHGTLNTETGALADSQSIYAVASNTKAFTSAAIAQLVDAGVIDWDDRVQDYLPDFELYDAYVSSELRIADLLCHRSGLATFSGDLLWYGSTLSSDEVLERAKHLEPTSAFRTEFGYQNILFIAAGKVIETVSGQRWIDYIQDSLLLPLGMERAFLSTRDIEDVANVAQPHNELKDGSLTPIDWVNWDNMAPAGALLTSVDEMAKWMIAQLDSGRYQGDHRLWEAEQTDRMWTMYTPIPVSRFYQTHHPTMHFRGYGLGWELATLHGRKIVGHSGGYDGMISRQMLVPQEKLGIFIATNTNSSVPWAMGFDVLGILLEGAKSTPMLDYLKERKSHEPEEAIQAQAELDSSRVLGTKPSHNLEDYTGTYSDIMYGNIVVGLRDGNLYFEFEPTPLFVGHFEHWHYDTFRLHWDHQMMLPSGMAHFSTNPAGEVYTLDIDVPNPDFDFTELHFVKQ